MADFILSAPKGANKKKRRVGRGSSSGQGTTAGKGNKGQQSRSGGKVYVGFEGGQMPLFRRIARRGFSNHTFKKVYSVVNVALLEEKFQAGMLVNKTALFEKGLIGSMKESVKILGNGTLTKNLTIEVERVSASARDKIEKSGGSVKVTVESNEEKK